MAAQTTESSVICNFLWSFESGERPQGQLMPPLLCFGMGVTHGPSACIPLDRTGDVAPFNSRARNCNEHMVPVSHKWLCFVAIVRRTCWSDKRVSIRQTRIKASQLFCK